MKTQKTPNVNGKNWNEMMERELGEGYSFIKKKCFICGSLSHLIRDCDFYEKKMAREVELKKQRVFNTVQLNTVRPHVNTVRQNVNSVRSNVNIVRPKQPVPTSNSNSFSLVRPQDPPLKNMEDRGIFDSGCSRHMTGNKDYLCNTPIFTI
ncbi:ribonuclease H-like domain-containing protein [Tanacetum coccineum]